jgi:hypothetical protein
MVQPVVAVAVRVQPVVDRLSGTLVCRVMTGVIQWPLQTTEVPAVAVVVLVVLDLMLLLQLAAMEVLDFCLTFPDRTSGMAAEVVAGLSTPISSGQKLQELVELVAVAMVQQLEVPNRELVVSAAAVAVVDTVGWVGMAVLVWLLLPTPGPVQELAASCPLLAEKPFTNSQQ